VLDGVERGGLPGSVLAGDPNDVALRRYVDGLNPLDVLGGQPDNPHSLLHSSSSIVGASRFRPFGCRCSIEA
ncbi:hypothetical protein LCGC14_0738630, partial [marine sediment metagenome]